MKKMKRFAALTGSAALVGFLLTPTAAGAQTAPVICDGLPATIVGTAGDDELTGTPGNDVIFAAQGNDIIFGLGGDDVICAGQGNDIVMGGQGFDIIFGAQGNDVLFAADGSTAADRADTRGARMFGGAGNDLMVGSNRWDRMQGGLGVDHFEGYEGRDWIRGGGDADFLNGGAGIDDTNGGNGADRMLVTTGDLVRGSNGNDLCAILGEPELLRSCTRNAQAFATARQIPIMPPTAEGIAQANTYEAAVINSRDNAGWEDIFDATCQVTDIDEFYDQIDTLLGGSNWTITLDAVAITVDGLTAEVNLDFFYTAPNQEILLEGNQDDLYVYEEGAWRISNFCFD